MMRTAISNYLKVVVTVPLLFALSGYAQEARVASSQVEVARRNFDMDAGDPLLPVFAPESESDKDLGIQLVMQPQDAYDPFFLSTYAGYAYTTNAGLDDDGGDTDHIFQSSALASYRPILFGNVYGDFQVRGSLFRYEDRSDLDFESFEGGAGIIKVFRSLSDLSASVRYTYTEYSGLDPIVSDSYSEHGVEAGLFKGHMISRNQFAYASWMSEFSVDGEPDYTRRDEHMMSLGYRLTPMPDWKVELFSRTAFHNYTEVSRQDWNQSFGGALTYNFTPNIYVSAYVAWTANQSNLDTRDYEVWNPGIRIGGNWKF